MANFEKLTPLVVGALLVTAVSCTVSKTPAPPLTGPSELSLSLVVTATPDLITANGSSVVGVVARDASGQPRPNVQLRIDTVGKDASGLETITDIGQLSPSHTVTTDAQGVASVVFTAPPQTVALVTVRVLPISANSGSETPRYVTIRLVAPTPVIVPGAPVPTFTITPSAPNVNQLVSFDASQSYDPDGSIVSYKWDWGDGESITKSTPFEDHDFAVARIYTVTLTVTDNAGQSSLSTKQLAIK